MTELVCINYLLHSITSATQPTKSPSFPPTKAAPPSHCGCASCTESVWDAPATDGGGTYSCGARISWLQSNKGLSELDACKKVAGVEFPNGPCGPMCDPLRC